jgi:hypothetical protein
MKAIYSFLFFIGFRFSTFAQVGNACDGPYISYANNQVIIRSINSDSAAVIDSFNISEIGKHPAQIQFSNHPGWDFSVPIRKVIENEPSEWKPADKLFAISDIEGEFENFRNLLIVAGVMDSSYQWIFGRGNLVICGDLFDRGKDVAAELWLLYKLEDEARVKGGYVHTILGNHDIMNLSGDLRYVQPKYMVHAKSMGVNYMDLYSNKTELGRWLRSKNTIEKIGSNLCMHGGLSPQILARKMDLNSINTRCRPFYDKTEHPELITDSSMRPFFGDDALFWYRGYFQNPKARQSMVDSTLNFYQCELIIVGHTIVMSNIASYYQGKIIGLDVHEHEGHSEGILIQGDTIEVVHSDGQKIILEPGPAKPVVE